MKTKNIKEKIKEFFFINPNSRLRVREIERTLKLPLPSVIRYCRELEKEEILKTVKKGSVIFYTSNRTSKNFRLEKKLFNIKQLHESELIEHIKKELHNPTTILFGSYAKGEDVENSDIDIYIETPSPKNINTDKYEKKLERKIQLFKHKNIKEIKNIHLANNIINGIPLNKQIEV